MAEVLGAVAAAAQLTATCLALIELTKRIKARNSTLKNYQEQLLQLQFLSDNISSNPLLQTPEIELHTRNIISLLSHQTLEQNPSKSRASQLFLFFTQERTISKLFIDLERHKATLSLVINDLQSRALHQIQNNLSTMSAQETYKKNHEGTSPPTVEATNPWPAMQPPTILRSAEYTSPLPPGMVTYFPSGAVVIPARNVEGRFYGISTAQKAIGAPEPSQSAYNPSTKNIADDSDIWTDFVKRQSGGELPPAAWINPVASGNVEMLNGAIIEEDVEFSVKAPGDAGKPPVWAGPVAEGGAYQHNGVEFKNANSKTFDQMQGHYIGVRALGNAEGPRVTRQVNGPIYRSGAARFKTFDSGRTPK